MNLTELQKLMADGLFHHATHRNRGTLWEGLWIYRKDPNGFRGFDLAGAFLVDDPEYDAACEATFGTGVSIGSYGQG